jgi:hypothetical protein
MISLDDRSTSGNRQQDWLLPNYVGEFVEAVVKAGGDHGAAVVG